MKKDSITYVLGFMLVITVFFGTGVSLVHHGTKDMLARNEQLHRNRTIAQAFNLDVPGRDAEAFAQAVQEHVREFSLRTPDRTWAVFERVTEHDDESRDIGFIFQGRGVWDIIRGVIVLNPDLNTVLNLRIMEQAETPGLGGRIEEEGFLAQFQGLRIDWERQPDRRVILATGMDPDAEGRVDAITGATGTSRALIEMLNNELHEFRLAYQANIQTTNSEM
ncbi:Na+-transporting NADH:ubiquinone oxidoreductase subunit C [Desulfonatronum thiosulfatophilum]|uniref:Na+-transporting NADH:ubiquinone oxidoreductase subunit C n=1 Tax=Desulfonatronum thiosulfatophilum TaxID=617002 RepID=A0A1G6EID4_9BACT|nr:FMN-binding protein [Desulfonatronum thiosulfatophilum]SDB57114.1 Na+-transporting NADH:ubiquinone oxidoreductase subunit C [Desulfonatronum thiosulfatophilum]